MQQRAGYVVIAALIAVMAFGFAAPHPSLPVHGQDADAGPTLGDAIIDDGKAAALTDETPLPPNPVLAADQAIVYLPYVGVGSGFSTPTPALDSSGQSPNMYLAWRFSSQRMGQPSFTVYLEANDPTPDEVVAANLPNTLVDPPTFRLNTDYFWQVVATDAGNRREISPIWHFRTDAKTHPRSSGVMVTVPAGEFLMGCDLNNTSVYGCSTKDTPLHKVWLDTFQIDRFEVTNSMYRTCVQAGRCDEPRKTNSHRRETYFYDAAYNDYPVLFVSHWDAEDYCRFVGKRLPTEAEWEKAARGNVDTRIFPWGNDFPNCTLANFTEDFYKDDVYACVDDTTAAGTHPLGASIYGAQDMAGNAFEWVKDNYYEGYYSRSPYINPISTKGDYFTMRGGSYRPRLIYIRVSHRHFGHHGDGVGDDSPFFRNDQVGFRCAR